MLFVGGGPGQREDINWAVLGGSESRRLSRIDRDESHVQGVFQPDFEVAVCAMDVALKYFQTCLKEHVFVRSLAPVFEPPARDINSELESYLIEIKRYIPIYSSIVWLFYVCYFACYFKKI